ncbi:FecR family protein [Pseudopedobacter beijingensis]|uniref:FecR family protein n=1 Tax=Pseudopedobacter beijingensis TaxID=1207056 RepID=A0ABW4I8H3_9SPHI
MSEERLYQLLKEYFNNTISSEDCIGLLKFLADAKDEQTLLLIDEVLSEFKKGVVFSPKQSEEVYKRILEDVRFKQMRKAKFTFTINYQWLRYAAIFLIFMAAGIYFINSYRLKLAVEQDENIAVIKLPIADTSNVRLTTSDGASIMLDSVSVGNSLKDLNGGAEVNKTGEKMLAYEERGKNWIVKTPVLHTLSVPRGITYRVQLPDGTNVWLNAASSLTYPSEFLGKQRKVVLSGEAYFEVAKDKNKPFIVESNGNSVEVLGTHFNVLAYKDDNLIKTTLLEGSVKMFNQSSSVVLVPGKQAVVKKNESAIEVKAAKIEEVMAWKNGYFVFEDADIESIMKELARWYNIDVEYKGINVKQRFGGTFSKNKNLKDLLEYLETLGDVQFVQEGRRVIVMR